MKNDTILKHERFSTKCTGNTLCNHMKFIYVAFMITLHTFVGLYIYILHSCQLNGNKIKFVLLTHYNEDSHLSYFTNAGRHITCTCSCERHNFNMTKQNPFVIHLLSFMLIVFSFQFQLYIFKGVKQLGKYQFKFP